MTSITLRELAKAHGGLEVPDTRLPTWQFDAADAVTVAGLLGAELHPPTDRPIRLSAQPDGRVCARFDSLADDADFQGWLRRKTEHVRKLDVAAGATIAPEDLAWLDDNVRATRTSADHIGQYMVRCRDGDWMYGPSALAYDRCFLRSQRDARQLLGHVEHHPWRLVSEPFAPAEDAERRTINTGAQYAYQPAPGQHPHWDLVLSHCGADLPRDYLLRWAAILFRQPSARLPYLFFYGPQNSGKSTYHEALALLFSEVAPGYRPGVASVDRALTGNFNSEVEGAVLAYVEETNVAKCPAAYAKIKDLTTAETIWIERKYATPYPSPNYLHFVQSANNIDACPVPFGDTRITVAYVAPLQTEIPKPILLDRLRAEAPAFLHTLLNCELPQVSGRLALAPIETQSKRQAAESSVDELATGLVALMAGSPTLSLTVRQIQADLPEVRCGNIRSVETRLSGEGEQAYLAAHGITFGIERDKHASATLVLRRRPNAAEIRAA